MTGAGAVGASISGMTGATGADLDFSMALLILTAVDMQADTLSSRPVAQEDIRLTLSYVRLPPNLRRIADRNARECLAGCFRDSTANRPSAR